MRPNGGIRLFIRSGNPPDHIYREKEMKCQGCTKQRKIPKQCILFLILNTCIFQHTYFSVGGVKGAEFIPLVHIKGCRKRKKKHHLGI